MFEPVAVMAQALPVGAAFAALHTGANNISRALAAASAGAAAFHVWTMPRLTPSNANRLCSVFNWRGVR